jgi:replicative DNA helicase
MTLRSEQLAPHSVEAEEAALGGVLLGGEDVLDTMPFLTPDHFFIERHAWIYEAMLKLKERRDAVDHMTVSHELEMMGRLAETGGLNYLMSLYNKTPSALNVAGYGKIVRRMAYRRQIIAFCEDGARLAHSEETEIRVIYETMYNDLTSLSSTGITRPRTMKVLMEEYTEQLAKHMADDTVITPFDTGLGDHFNQLFGNSYAPGMFIVIGAYTNAGKTWLLIQLAMNAAATGVPVLFVTLESSGIVIRNRMVAVQSGLPYTQVSDMSLRGDHAVRAFKVADELATLPMEIQVLESLDQIEGYLADMAIRYDFRPGIVFIDDLDTLAATQFGSQGYESYTKLFPRILPSALRTNWCFVGAKQLLVPRDTKGIVDNQTLYNKLNPNMASFEGGSTVTQKASMACVFWDQRWIREKVYKDFSHDSLPPGKVMFKRLRARDDGGGVTGCYMNWNETVPRFERAD